MEIKRAEISDLEQLTENRAEFVVLIRPIANMEEFKIHTRGALKRQFEDKSIISYLAMDNGKIVASCILSIYEVLPTPGCLSGKRGLLLNVYTHKEYRRQGLASQLLTRLIEDAKQEGVGKIQLDYTDDGYELYKKLGFKQMDREMELVLL